MESILTRAAAWRAQNALNENDSNLDYGRLQSDLSSGLRPLFVIAGLGHAGGPAVVQAQRWLRDGRFAPVVS
jgi:hypothetical protein